MLTEIKIRSAKPRVNTYRLFDGGGLYLELSPRGGKWWRLKYRYKGKEARMSLGVYPAVGLKEARGRRDAARRLLTTGIDPAAARKAEKAAEDDTVEAVAREWHDKQRATWTAAHAAKVLSRLERTVFPTLGSRPVGAVTASELLVCLRRLEGRGTGNVAHLVLQDLGRVFRYAIATGRAERNPAVDLRGALPPVKHRHHPAITDPKEVGELLRAIDYYHGYTVVQSALKLLALTFVRPGELRFARWPEVEIWEAEWRIPAERMKMNVAHIVPLSEQAGAVLRELYKLTGNDHRYLRYVFAGRRRGQPISDTTLNAALRGMGYQGRMSAHGFRAMARTLLDEVLGVRPDIIEHQLAHQVRDPLGRAYNRTQHLPERRDMMQRWADYLDGLKNGAEVVPLRRQANEF